MPRTMRRRKRTTSNLLACKASISHDTKGLRRRKMIAFIEGRTDREGPRPHARTLGGPTRSRSVTRLERVRQRRRRVVLGLALQVVDLGSAGTLAQPLLAARNVEGEGMRGRAVWSAPILSQSQRLWRLLC